MVNKSESMSFEGYNIKTWLTRNKETLKNLLVGVSALATYFICLYLSFPFLFFSVFVILFVFAFPCSLHVLSLLCIAFPFPFSIVSLLSPSALPSLISYIPQVLSVCSRRVMRRGKCQSLSFSDSHSSEAV